MTRFARAKGSKASNTRAVEEATSWQDMKRSLVKKPEETRINVERQQPEKTTKTPTWCEFPDAGQHRQPKAKRKRSMSEPSEPPAKKPKKLNKAEVMNQTKKLSERPEPSKKSKKQKLKACDQQLEPKPAKSVSEKPKRSKKKIKTQNSGASDASTKETKRTNKENKNATSQDRQNTEVETVSPFSKTEKQKLNLKHNMSNHGGKNNKFNNKFQQRGFAQRADKFQKQTGDYQRRKPNSQVEKVIINGVEIEISYYDGFPIKSEDAERLIKLKKEMISRGLPRSEVAAALKLERRKAEKALAREKKKVCFNCRRSGHNLSECPELKEGSNAQMCETGICFKCGSTEHTHFECRVVRGDKFKFAQCFICKEQGHISRQCPDNNKGLYPKGGACRVCGDVTHLKKDCPAYQAQQSENKVVAETIGDHNIEALDNVVVPDKVKKKKEKSHRIVKF